MQGNASDPPPDARDHELDPARARVGPARLPAVSAELAALIGVGIIGLVWLSNVDSDPRPARMRLAPGDGDPRSLTMSFALSPDGTTMATIHEDGRVALRKTTGGDSLPRALGYSGKARAVAFSPDSQ
jgi:hypothetical protein